MSYMADGDAINRRVDQDEENGSLRNHIADDGSMWLEPKRIVTVSEDLEEILVQVNGALERMTDGKYGTCQRCGKSNRRRAARSVPLCRLLYRVPVHHRARAGAPCRRVATRSPWLVSRPPSP